MFVGARLQCLRTRLQCYYKKSVLNSIQNGKFSSVALDCIPDDNLKYTKDDEIQVLKYLNETTPEELIKLKIAKTHLKKLIDQRLLKGEFQSFSDTGLNVKVLKKIVDIVLNYDVQREEKSEPKQKLKGIIDPALNLEQIELIRSITALYIDYNTICWARIERDTYTITDWQLFNIECESNKKLHLSEIIQALLNVYSLLPKSDIYVMESEATLLRSTGSNVNNPKMVNVNLQKAQTVATLSGMIAALGNSEKFFSHYSSDENDFVNVMYYLRPSLPSRFFKTLVGSECVSSLPIIDKIINSGLIYENDKNHLLNFSESCKTIYNEKKDFEREHLGRVLMLLVTFYELCILKSSKAIDKLIK